MKKLNKKANMAKHTIEAYLWICNCVCSNSAEGVPGAQEGMRLFGGDDWLWKPRT